MKKDNKTIHEIAVALTAVEKSPLIIKKAEELKGQILSDELVDALAEAAFKQARPINNTYGYTPSYRKNMVRTYVRSALQETLVYATGKGGAV
jgi:CO/xanthine dehydrogenase FAD-binding subunit